MMPARRQSGSWILSRSRSLVVVLSALAGAQGAGAAGEVEVVVDAAKVAGVFRPLHGVNNGPLDLGDTVDLSAYHRELALPSTRLHDCHWPNPDVVDIHAVFPDPAADPSRPESYDFSRTDAYIRAIVATGAPIVYRLGESIEHTKRKYRVHPPADPEAWAAICVGIIRHDNEGWADGHHFGIRDWEVWNEPDNRPNMWTGTDEDYFRLYGAAARAIKRRFPALRVGGPAVGNVGRMQGGRLEPSPFVARFLEYCRRETVPLDFFSWHLYAADPRELAARARGVRDLLDRLGFPRTESHLNEWNYLPDDDWAPIVPGGQGLPRQRCYERIGGPEGAAFAACALLWLQDSPVDAANYYTADTNPFGLFTRHGVPRKTFYAFRAFTALLATPIRLEASGGVPSRLALGAGMSRDRAALTVLIGLLGSTEETIVLTVKGVPWEGEADFEVRLVDAGHDLDPVRTGRLPAGASRISQPLKAPVVCTITLRKPTAQDRSP
jgi:xylan 1,4-beta-xylosidase